MYGHNCWRIFFFFFFFLRVLRFRKVMYRPFCFLKLISFVLHAVLLSALFTCRKKNVLALSEVPPAPLAEIFFATYNPSMNHRGTRNGISLKNEFSVLAQHDPLHLLERQKALQSEEESRGFCFASIGCWGGDIPHTELQTKVRDQLIDVLDNGVNFSKLGETDRITSLFEKEEKKNNTTQYKEKYSRNADKTRVRDPSLFPIHFVLTAGDNFYPSGVSSFRDLSFYTTFESFYDSDMSTSSVWDEKKEKKNLRDQKSKNAAFIPWIVALGNHDAIQRNDAEVEYTYDSIRHASDLAHEWRQQVNSSLGHPGREEYTEDVALQQRLRIGKALTPTGRWYMPNHYFPIQVSPDTVVIVIDVPEMHRCAIYNKSEKKMRMVDVDSEMMDDDRSHGINVSEKDCIRSKNQQNDVAHWLLETYRDALYKIVVGHYPMKGNGPHENYPFLVNWLEPLLKQSCAVLYIHADNHYLQVSHDGLQYYAGTGAGAGNKGKLHHPGRDGRPFWYHTSNKFQAIQGGFMVHCALHTNKQESSSSFVSSSSSSSPELKRRFINIVIGEDGQKLFTFEINLDELQFCHKNRLKLASGNAFSGAEEREGQKQQKRKRMKYGVGIMLLLLGGRVLVTSAWLKLFFSKVRPKWRKNESWTVQEQKKMNCNRVDFVQLENLTHRSPVSDENSFSISSSFPYSKPFHFKHLEEEVGVTGERFDTVAQPAKRKLIVSSKLLHVIIGCLLIGIGIICIFS